MDSYGIHLEYSCFDPRAFLLHVCTIVIPFSPRIWRIKLQFICSFHERIQQTFPAAVIYSKAVFLNLWATEEFLRDHGLILVKLSRFPSWMFLMF